MGGIETTMAKANFKYKTGNEEFLNSIGRKLPKKLRKKLYWEKIAPILNLLIAVLVHLINARSSQREADPGLPAEKRAPFVPSRQRDPVPLTRFHDDRLRAYVAQAEAYQAEVERLAQTVTDETGQSRARELAAHMQVWTNSIISLAQRIDTFRQNKLIVKDLKDVPQSIDQLEVRLSQELNPTMRTELERTLTHRRQQWAALKKLQGDVEMAEIKIETTLSMLGTLYSQILLGQSTRQTAVYHRLLNEIDEEVCLLQDHLEALEEVKLAQL